MALQQRPDHHLSSNFTPQLSNQPRSGSSTAATSPVEPTSGGSVRLPIGSGLPNTSNGMAGLRTGSPSHEYGGRLYSKRAREIQAQEGVGPQVWCPPASGNSTPLRETIPESPNGDGFPDFNQASGETSAAKPAVRGRTRAGTLPSRFSPAAGLNILNPQTAGLIPKTSRPTPSTSPFQPGSSTPTEVTGFPNTNSALLQRLRAGSMPQRGNFMPSAASPFGPSLFSTSWANRERTTTLSSIRSSDAPSSPAQSSFSRDGFADTDVKTLDYLGLVDTPKPSLATISGGSDINALLNQQASVGLQPQAIADLAALTKNANRFRSYSVNAKEKYADEEDDMSAMGYGNYSGTLTPEGSAAAYAIHEAVRQHNLEVQAFANFASANRPRARTAGVLDSPSTRLMRNYLPTPSRLDSSITASDLQLSEEAEYSGLEEAVEKLQLNGGQLGEDHGLETPTRALWLGGIPASTTVSSLNVIFSTYGPIESTRVLTHKNCGFVNYENLESAVNARSHLHGKEIFPGAGPIRINFAKVPSASGTPGNSGLMPSPTPDPQVKTEAAPANGAQASEPRDEPSLTTLELTEIKADIIAIVKELGATDEEQLHIAQNVDQAIQHNLYEAEIPPIPEPSHNRVHDAPRLREIRKRIDNNTCSQVEIEDVAMNMLPEIAELSSDYLGNTVVQKLFEFCSETVKEAMLNEIGPHLAEIGVHKNGTWAAQKIIDVARTPTLMAMVVEALRPYGMTLFLDQFGNYVMQGCLRYNYPLNNFIFEVMLSRLWELAQGRFGARAMRACLESHYATKDQQRMIAAAIALHSVQLATNANGALLLTWFLDTCTFPRRRSVLAPRLVPHLVHLCTHKVAYLTVLKIINQRNEPEARDTILQALFFSANDMTLEDILSDQQCGATLIFKVLTTPFFDEKIRSDVVQNVRNVLIRIKAQPQQGYKRLMDEVGLSTRSSGPRDMHPREDNRPTSKHSNANGHIAQNHAVDSPLNRPYYPGVAQNFDPAISMQRTGSVDSSTFDAYSLGGLSNPAASVYPSNHSLPLPSMAPHQQLQYQQAMLAAASRSGAPGASYFPGAAVNVNGYPSPASPLDAFRSMTGPMASAAGSVNSSLLPQAGFAAPPGFGMVSAGPGPGGQAGFMQYPPGMFVPQSAAAASGMHAGVVGGRRGRVS